MLNYSKGADSKTEAVLLLVASICGLCAGLSGWLPPVWPLAQLAMLLPPLTVWLIRGRTPRLTWGTVAPLPVLIPAVAAAVALPLWLWLDPAANVDFPLPDLPIWALALAGLGFAAINAAIEELCFRGLLQDALHQLMPGRAWAAVVLQGAAFGLAHWAGFPSGWWGVLLAGSWGIALGYVRHRCKGLLAPWLAHIVADLVIFTLLWLNQS